MYVPDSYIIAHILEDTLAPDGSRVLVFNWAWLFLAAMLHFVLVCFPYVFLFVCVCALSRPKLQSIVISLVHVEIWKHLLVVHRQKLAES